MSSTFTSSVCTSQAFTNRALTNWSCFWTGCSLGRQWVPSWSAIRKIRFSLHLYLTYISDDDEWESCKLNCCKCSLKFPAVLMERLLADGIDVFLIFFCTWDSHLGLAMKFVAHVGSVLLTLLLTISSCASIEAFYHDLAWFCSLFENAHSYELLLWSALCHSILHFVTWSFASIVTSAFICSNLAEEAKLCYFNHRFRYVWKSVHSVGYKL